MEPTQVAAQPTLDGTSALLEGAVSSTAEVGAKVFVRDLADGARVESPFVVRDVARRQKRNGDSFLKLQLGDVTGAVEGVVWDGIDEAAATATPGSVVIAVGAFSVDQRYGACLTVRSLRTAAAHEYDPADHHGPTLYYSVVPVARLRGERTLAELTETTVRLVPAIAGTASAHVSEQPTPASVISHITSGYLRFGVAPAEQLAPPPFKHPGEASLLPTMTPAASMSSG